MSMDYRIKIKLYAEFNRDNIYKIINKGAFKQFIYFDQITYEKYFDIPTINTLQTVEKLINAFQDNIEGGSCVYTMLGKNETHAMLYFSRSDDQFLIFEMGTFADPRKKVYYIDFAYYMTMCFDIVDDFEIIEIHADMQ